MAAKCSVQQTDLDKDVTLRVDEFTWILDAAEEAGIDMAPPLEPLFCHAQQGYLRLRGHP